MTTSGGLTSGGPAPGIFGTGPDADQWRRLEPPGGKGVLLRLDPKFVVFLNEHDDVDWECTPAHDEVLAKANGYSAIQGTITVLEATPVDHLPVKLKLAFRSILGEAMCAVMEEQPKAAVQLLARAEAFVTARNSEHARRWYLTGTWVAAAIAAGMAVLLWLGFYPWSTTHPDAGANVLAVGVGGTAGGLFSILLRVGSAPLDPSGGREIHWTEGAARVGVGVVAAAIAVTAVRVRLVFPQLADGPYGIVLVAMVAGSSERLASAIAERVEGLLAKDNTAKAATRKKI